jgi:hypothetical protein
MFLDISIFLLITYGIITVGRALLAESDEGAPDQGLYRYQKMSILFMLALFSMTFGGLSLWNRFVDHDLPSLLLVFVYLIGFLSIDALNLYYYKIQDNINKVFLITVIVLLLSTIITLIFITSTYDAIGSLIGIICIGSFMQSIFFILCKKYKIFIIPFSVFLIMLYGLIMFGYGLSH